MDTDSGRNKCIWRPQNIGDKLISSFAGQRKLSIMETYPRILFYSGRCYQRYTWWYHLLWNAFHWDKFSKWSKAAESPALLGLTTGIRPKEQFGWLLWWEDICQLLSASYLKDQSILSCNRTAAREAPIPLSIDTFSATAVLRVNRRLHPILADVHRVLSCCPALLLYAWCSPM